LSATFPGALPFGGKPLLPQTPSRYIMTSDGVDLHVVVKGKGTPCLYIHGGPGCGSYWLEKFSGDTLEQRFQMIYLDQRGSGRSTSPRDGNYTMDRMAGDFEEVRKVLGIQQWITLGHSFGGILQMGYAKRYPHAIKGMIMLNCSLKLNESLTAAIPKACEILEVTDTKHYTDEAIPLGDRIQDLYGKLREKDLFWKMAYASHRSMEIMDASFDEIPDRNKDFENFNIMTIKEYGEDYKKAAPDIRMPVLFFYGRTDWLVGPTHYKGINFPEVMLWGSDVGHVASLENKGDLENAIASYQKKYGL